MNAPTKLILGSTAFLVLVLGIANLWLMARNAREASVARDRHVVELQTELATLRNSIDRQTTVLGRAFEAKTADLARLAEANGQRVRAIDDRLGRLATAVDDARQEQANSVHGLMERVQLQAEAQSELQAALCTIDARVMGLRAMPALHDLVLATAQIVQTWLARRPALATTTSPPMTAPAPKIPAVAPRKDKK